jgi:hypothetical protein
VCLECWEWERILASPARLRGPGRKSTVCLTTKDLKLGACYSISTNNSQFAKLQRLYQN